MAGVTRQEYVEEVLSLVERIPEGRVMSYGAIADVRVSYPMDLEQQMLEWSGRRAPP